MSSTVSTHRAPRMQGVGEMEEISAFVRDGLGDGEAHVHQGFAHLYDRVEKALPDGEDIAVLKKFVEEAKATMNESKDS